MTYRVVSLTSAMVALVAVLALGQQAPPSPGPGWVAQDGGWLPPGHPAIRAVTSTPETPLQACERAQPTGATSLDLLKACGHLLGTPLPGCEHVNAYAEPERAVECSERALKANPPTVTIRHFVLGGLYARPYSERTILIIGTALGLDGVEVVTAQVVDPEPERGTPVAFLNDGGVTAGQWWPALNGGGR